MSRAYNFGAGPSMLPESLLEEIREELFNWQGTGMSILEIGHRTPEFIELLQEAEYELRTLLNISEHYHILFLGGAARSQFSMIPLNLLSKGKQAGYWLTGLWSEQAYKEAKRLKKAYRVMQNSCSTTHSRHWLIKENTEYLFFTANETIDGIRFSPLPLATEIPLVADMTSNLLTEPINIDNYGLIFAGAQKNIANAGLTLVIVRDDLLKDDNHKQLPAMLNYKFHCQEKSLAATPPTFNCYLALKMFRWIKKQGGISLLYEKNCLKAQTLYEYIDQSDFYVCNIPKNERSLVNICFNLQSPTLEYSFLKQATEHGLLALKGHRLIGGLRASLYNSMPLEGVLCLIQFMKDFAQENGE